MNYNVFDRILGILCSVLDAYSTVLFLPEDGQSTRKALEHRVRASFSLGDKIDRSVVICEGQGLIGWILRNQEPLLVANFDQRTNHLGYYSANEEHTIKAFMGCPVGNGLGVLCVDSKRQYSFSEKDQKMLHLFSDFLAQFHQEIAVAKEQQDSVKYYTALQSVYALRHQYSRWSDFLKNFLDLMATMTGFSYCSLCTRDSYGENYVLEAENSPLLIKKADEPPSYSMSHGLVGWVFRNGVPIMTDGIEGAPETPLVGSAHDITPFQSSVAFPLVIQRKTRGVLCFGHNAPLPMDTALKDFIRMGAEHLALFLENLYVKCKLRDLHRHVHADEGGERQ